MPSPLRYALLLALAAAVCAVAIVFFGGDVTRPQLVFVSDDQRYPDGCEAFELTRRRCDAIVASIARRRNVDLDAVSEVRLMGPRRCGDRPLPCRARRGFVVRVEFIRQGAPSVSGRLTCGPGGIGWRFDELCSNAPPVFLTIPDPSGHGDIPCPGEPPDGCATPVAPIDPGLAGLGIPLRVPSLAIPLDHVGAYEVDVGVATLPNGLLTEAALDLVEEAQEAFLLEEGRVRLEILDPAGEPLGFGYVHERQAGLQQVRVRITFVVTSYDPGTVLHFQGLVVR